ncbi:MAG: hypothetical protein AAB113_06230 [Candidatus Eisenbacteria bacterium]
MRIRTLLLVPAALVTALALTVAAFGQGGTQVNKPQQAQPATVQAQPAAPAAAPAPPAKPVVLGKAETAKWTATTLEAATSEAHKKVLEGGKVATVTGEVVDVSCYLQLGKRGEAHVACGTKCIANGQPIGVVDADGNLYIVMAEEHHPRRDGQVELKTVLGPLLAKTVTLTGMMTEMKGYRALFVQAAELGGTVKPAETGGMK